MSASAIPKFVPRFIHPYVGEGRFLPFLAKWETKIPFLGTVNSVYNLAPASKWGLSIVPLLGIMSGKPEPKDIDFNSSAALTCTGMVWTFYALIITPQNAGSRVLATVNCAMASVNGYNCYRKAQYDRSLKQ